MKKSKIVEFVEKYVEERIIKITLLVFILIVLFGGGVHGGVIFVVTSAVGFVRFYCRSDLMNVAVNRINSAVVQSLINYILSLIVTGAFIAAVCFTYRGKYIIYGIIGTVMESIIIVVFGVIGHLSKISITKRR